MLEGQPTSQREKTKQRVASGVLGVGKTDLRWSPAALVSRWWRWASVVTALVVTVVTIAWSAHLGGAQTQPAATPAATPEPRPVACEVTPAHQNPEPDELALAPRASDSIEADAATVAELDLLAHTLAACLSAGDSRTVASLVTEQHLSALYVGGADLSREAILALVADLPATPMEIRSINEARLEAAGGASADVVYVVANQLLHGRWTFTRQVITDGTGAGNDTRWVVASESPHPVTPPADATTVQVGISEYAFDLQPAIVDGTAVVLEATNDRDEDHEMLVLRVESGISTDALLRQPGPALPDGFTFIGQTIVPAGEEGSLVLVDLDPGVYALVDLLPDPAGNPHLALGMEAELTIE